MDGQPLRDRSGPVTGAADRIGRALAIACARAGADVFGQDGGSEDEASEAQRQIVAIGRRAWILQADLNRAAEAAEPVVQANKNSELFALVNSAAVFSALTMDATGVAEWQSHLAVNLTAPFLFSQAFGRPVSPAWEGRLINILAWPILQARSFTWMVSGTCPRRMYG